MPHHIKTSFLEAFKRFSACNFIMKTAIDTKDKELFNQYSNVYTMKWINQRNILSHSKTKAFITHAGANSINEAVISGVPMITIPLFGDQKHNAAMVVNKNLGIYFRLSDITKNRLIDALEEILLNPRFKSSSKKIREQLQDKIITEDNQFITDHPFVRPSVHQSFHPSVLPPVRTPVIQSICLSVRIYISPSVHLSDVSLFVHLFFRPSIPSFRPPVLLCVFPKNTCLPAG
uniref:UDP-glucuronosyltransferase n=1 Tax=Acrobeloides nanus TaxID=290746 RepID=A0A914BYF3_9BILA